MPERPILYFEIGRSLPGDYMLRAWAQNNEARAPQLTPIRAVTTGSRHCVDAITELHPLTHGLCEIWSIAAYADKIHSALVLVSGPLIHLSSAWPTPTSASVQMYHTDLVREVSQGSLALGRTHTWRRRHELEPAHRETTHALITAEKSSRGELPGVLAGFESCVHEVIQNLCRVQGNLDYTVDLQVPLNIANLGFHQPDGRTGG